jgi:hypothetical protein
LRTNVGQHQERHGQKNRKREFCSHDKINRSGILFHKKSYPTLAGIGDAGSCPEQGSAIPATVN